MCQIFSASPSLICCRIDGTYLPWLSNLTEKLDSLDPLPSNESLIPDDALLPPQVDIDFLSEQVLTSTSSNGNEFSISLSQEVTAGSSKAPIPQTGGWKEAKLTRNERMTSQDHYQDVRLIEWERPDGQEIRRVELDLLDPLRHAR